MYKTDIFRKLLPLQRICRRYKSEAPINIEKLEEESVSLEVVDEEMRTREKELERKRNKSRLREWHRNVLFERPPHPYEEAELPHQQTLRYARKLYGKYGQASGVDPSLCWPTKAELDEKLEYERIAYPYTILEVAEEARKKRQAKDEEIQRRQQEVIKNVAKLGQWKSELKNRVAKKEAEALAAKERKERLVEEVRRHFGYTVDPRDEKFKEMLEKKEKEQRKAMKEARKKAKDEKMIAAMLSKKSAETKAAETENEADANESKAKTEETKE